MILCSSPKPSFCLVQTRLLIGRACLPFIYSDTGVVDRLEVSWPRTEPSRRRGVLLVVLQGRLHDPKDSERGLSEHTHVHHWPYQLGLCHSGAYRQTTCSSICSWKMVLTDGKDVSVFSCGSASYTQGTRGPLWTSSTLSPL